jgi:hypothetical protein
MNEPGSRFLPVRACEFVFLDNGLKWKETIKTEENHTVVFETLWPVLYIAEPVSPDLSGRWHDIYLLSEH